MSELLVITSTLTRPLAQENFGMYIRRKSFKTCLMITRCRNPEDYNLVDLFK
jgi:hypothetical protein